MVFRSDLLILSICGLSQEAANHLPQESSSYCRQPLNQAVGSSAVWAKSHSKQGVWYLQATTGEALRNLNYDCLSSEFFTIRFRQY